MLSSPLKPCFASMRFITRIKQDNILREKINKAALYVVTGRSIDHHATN